MVQKSKIEWLRNPKDGSKGYSVNPIKGICKMGCDYCYAIREYHRFKWNPEVRFDYSVLDRISKIKIVKNGGYIKPKVFVCSTHDMFGWWIPEEWIRTIIIYAVQNPHIIFIYLTKNPQNAWKYTYPDNVWLGVTVESQEQVWRIKTLLQPEIKAKHKFVSFEPLQGEIRCDFNNYQLGEDNQIISWMIIGAETGRRRDKILPMHDWITKLCFDHADTPAFLKNNLKPYLVGCNLYQEFPKEMIE